MTANPDAFKVSIANIAIGPRIGFYNAPHAHRLGARMAAEGQQSPIQVKRNGNAAKQRWTLIAGLHRLRGAEQIGWTDIDAIQVADAGTPDEDVRRLELAENLSHRHRRPIERAIMMVEYARLEEALDHPDCEHETSQVRAARKRWNSEERDASVTMTDACGWRERTAQAFGCSISSIERHQRIHRALVEAFPDLSQRLNDHAFGESLASMMRLAGIKDDDARRRVVETILARSDWKSMNEVLVASGLHLSAGSRVDERNYRAVMFTTFEKMPLREKRQYLEELPKALTRNMAERLAVRLSMEFDL